MRLIKQKGFTLIEILIIMSIMIISFPIITHHAYVSFQHQQFNLFINELKSMLYDAQVAAIASGRSTSVIINKSDHRLFWIKGVGEQVESVIYAKSIDTHCGTNGCIISFTSQGRIRKPGTIIFLLGEERYKLVLLVGEGRFYVEKL